LNEAENQLGLAEDCLEEAKSLFSSGFYRGAASRAYYSMFHAAKALLAAKNISPKRHAGVLRMLSLEFVKEGLLEETYANAYKLAFDLRSDADYTVDARISEEMAEEVIPNAELFLKKAKEVLKEIRG